MSFYYEYTTDYSHRTDIKWFANITFAPRLPRQIQLSHKMCQETKNIYRLTEANHTLYIHSHVVPIDICFILHELLYRVFLLLSAQWMDGSKAMLRIQTSPQMRNVLFIGLRKTRYTTLSILSTMRRGRHRRCLESEEPSGSPNGNPFMDIARIAAAFTSCHQANAPMFMHQRVEHTRDDSNRKSIAHRSCGATNHTYTHTHIRYTNPQHDYLNALMWCLSMDECLDVWRRMFDLFYIRFISSILLREHDAL